MPDDLVWWTATRTAKALRDKEISAREVMQATLDQVDRVNPSVNALVTLVDRDDLLAQAGCCRRSRWHEVSRSARCTGCLSR